MLFIPCLLTNTLSNKINLKKKGQTGGKRSFPVTTFVYVCVWKQLNTHTYTHTQTHSILIAACQNRCLVKLPQTCQPCKEKNLQAPHAHTYTHMCTHSTDTCTHTAQTHVHTQHRQICTHRQVNVSHTQTHSSHPHQHQHQHASQPASQLPHQPADPHPLCAHQHTLWRAKQWDWISMSPYQGVGLALHAINNLACSLATTGIESGS